MTNAADHIDYNAKVKMMAERHLKDRLEGRLSPRQEQFSRNMATMTMTQSEAARQAGYKEKNCAVTASRLMQQDRIKLRIAQLMKEGGVRNDVSIDEIIANLRKARDEAFAANQFSAGIRATELLGKYLGLFSEKVAISRNEVLGAKDLTRLSRIASITKGARVV